MVLQLRCLDMVRGPIFLGSAVCRTLIATRVDSVAVTSGLSRVLCIPRVFW